jgi:two-component system cell cycle response regulator DivK
MKSILIVEDTPLNLDLLIQLLDDSYRLISAGDGATGVAKAEVEHPDLILMDISLPVMDGWAAIKKIKANPTLESTPIVGLSAHAMDTDRQKALQSGCDAYLTKPIDEELLVDTISRLIGV